MKPSKRSLLNCTWLGIALVMAAICSKPSYAAPHENGKPRILCQPESQIVRDGATFTFSVRVEGEPPDESQGFTFQWQTNMNFDLDDPDRGWTDIQNANADTYSKASSMADVGWYRVQVAAKVKNKQSFSEPASLLVFSGQGANNGNANEKGKGKGPRGTLLTLFGPPVLSSSPQSTCPGTYVAYVNYKQALPGWGWQPTNMDGYFIAQDGTMNSSTKVEMSGSSGDHPCSLSPLVQTNRLLSAKYRFTIYFASPPGTNSYPIKLIGFK